MGRSRTDTAERGVAASNHLAAEAAEEAGLVYTSLGPVPASGSR